MHEKNIAIVYITHRLQELFNITDELTVLKNGKIVSQGITSEYTLEQIIQMMVPKVSKQEIEAAEIELPQQAQQVDSHKEDGYILEVERLWGKGFRDVSVQLKKGEILGLTGVVGAGRTEFAEALFGITNKESGTIALNGKKVEIHSPRTAIELGLVYVPKIGTCTEDF